MNKYLLRIFKDIKFSSINKNYFKHNLERDFHIIAISQDKKNIFSEEIKKWNIIKSFSINYEKGAYSRRVFDKFLNKSLILYLVLDPNPKYEEENSNYAKKYFNKNSRKIYKNFGENSSDIFITREPKEFIEKFALIFGINAFKYLDLDHKELIKLKPLKNPLGTLGWNNFKEFISFANISCDWLILRNFEFLPFNFFKNDKDIDILCRNKEYFVKKLNLTKRSWGISAFQVKISGKQIPVDLRFLGDKYYDKLWQNNMLENKILQSKLVPRPCNLDYFYSLIYHCKLQKSAVKEIYSQILSQLIITLGINNLNKFFVYDDLITSLLLADFLNINNYQIPIPLDKNVKLNMVFYRYLKQFINKIQFSQPPFYIRLLLTIPLPLRNYLVKIKHNLNIT